MINSDNIVSVVASIIVILLQLLVSPLLNLFGATPNFIFAFIVAYAIVFSSQTRYVSAFILGTFFDLTQGSTVGAWMLLLVLSAILLRVFAQNIDSSNIVAQLILGIVVCVLINMVHMLILVLTTPSISLSALISSGVLWSLLLDSIAFVFLYVLFRIVHIKIYNKSAFGGYI